MFTLEESAHLGFMLRVLGWVLAALLILGGCWLLRHWLVVDAALGAGR